MQCFFYILIHLSFFFFYMHLFDDQVLEIYINATKKVDDVPIMLIKFYPLIFVLLRNC